MFRRVAPRTAAPFTHTKEVCPTDADSYISQNKNKGFADLLFSFIDSTGLKDSDIYKRALIDRRLFSKIRSYKDYVPSKKTVIALCLALELNRTKADELLLSAGYALSRADNYDLIISFCIEKKVFNFSDINEILEHFELETFE